MVADILVDGASLDLNCLLEFLVKPLIELISNFTSGRRPARGFMRSVHCGLRRPLDDTPSTPACLGRDRYAIG
jgi:hypothetical protein